jgi:hypothetical protein
MISAHVVQLISADLPAWPAVWADYINLISFSGFLLAFGLGVGFSTRRGRRWRALRQAVLLLAAYYVSALAYVTLVEQEPLRSGLLVELLLLKRLFGWSEFLASFAMLYFLLAIGRPALIWVATHWWSLLIALLASGASTVLVNSDNIPALATLIGTEAFASFPLLAYAGWFLCGIALAQQGGRPHFWHGLIALLATGGFFSVAVMTGDWPERFPPSALWVGGAALPLYLTYSLLSFLVVQWRVPAWALLPGRHPLTSLLASNLALFAVRYNWGHPINSIALWLLATLVLVAFAPLLWALSGRAKAAWTRSPEMA